MTDYAIDLEPFYEPVRDKPLIQNAIVMIRERKCKTDRWFSLDGHCYVFVDIHPEGIPRDPFAAKPSQVKAAISTNKIKILKDGTEHIFD